MNDLDRLHQIIDALPPQQVHALLTLLASPKPIRDEEFARCLAQAPEEEVDEETTPRIQAVEAEQGESISHGELKQRPGYVAPGQMAPIDLKAAYNELRRQMTSEGIPFLNAVELEREIAERKGTRF